MNMTQASLVVALQLEAVYLLHLGFLEVAYEIIQNRLSIPALMFCARNPKTPA